MAQACDVTEVLVPRVLLDACVLFPASLRDTLLRAAEAGLYHPRWSATILAELGRNLVSDGRLREHQVQRLLATMRWKFPYAEVEGYLTLADGMTNEPRDRHVLAATVVAECRMIVTSNLADFPEWCLAPFAVKAQSPDSFLLGLLDSDPVTVLRIVREQARDLRNPPMTVSQILGGLGKHVPGFAASVVAELA